MRRSDFKPLIIAALQSKGGTASVQQVTKYIWDNHRTQIENDPIAYSWQYDVRWAGQALKHDGIIELSKPRRGFWSLLV